MKAHIVTLPGDYIGPEIVAQAVKVLNAVAKKYGHTFCFDERRLGGASIDAFGVPLTDETLMDILNDKGYCIARRTVAKYREMLGIPVARLRKQI